MGPTAELIERFWAKVNKNGPTQPHMSTPCWEWTAFCNPAGYGMFRTNPKRMSLAHRVSFIWHVGELGKLQSLHRCDNPPCIRPDHLFAGTHADNMEDRRLKGRASNADRDMCINDHLFDRKDKVQRYCTTCKREASRRKLAKRTAEKTCAL